MFLPVTPDVLVVPSDLVPFAKEVPIRAAVYAEEGQEDASLLYQNVGKARPWDRACAPTPEGWPRAQWEEPSAPSMWGRRENWRRQSVKKI